MAKQDSTKTDFSSFMCIILMLTGALVTIMIANVMIIAANPENVQITSIIPTGMLGDEGKGQMEEVKDAFGNKIKQPWYLEVRRDRLVIYPGETIVNIKDLESKGNGFEQLMDQVEAKKEQQYVVLLVRPYASSIARQLKKILVDRKLDVGVDLLEKDIPIKLRNMNTNVYDKVETAS